jgi:hypothetical protein
MIWHEWLDLTWMTWFDMNDWIWHVWHDFTQITLMTWIPWSDMNPMIWLEPNDLAWFDCHGMAQITITKTTLKWWPKARWKHLLVFDRSVYSRQILFTFCLSTGGIMVSIAAFQVVDPDSIPGQRSLIFFTGFHNLYNWNNYRLSEHTNNN